MPEPAGSTLVGEDYSETLFSTFIKGSCYLEDEITGDIISYRQKWRQKRLAQQNKKLLGLTVPSAAFIVLKATR